MEPEPLHDAAPTPTATKVTLDIKCHKLQHFISFFNKVTCYIVGWEPEPHSNFYPEPEPKMHKNDAAPQHRFIALLRYASPLLCGYIPYRDCLLALVIIWNKSPDLIFYILNQKEIRIKNCPNTFVQCWQIRSILTGSGSDLWKKSDPVTDPT
jgi:hypothetical protein